MRFIRDNVRTMAESKERQAVCLLEREKNPETLHRAISYLRRAVQLWKTADGCTAHTAMALLGIGDLYCALENRGQGLRYYRQALSLYESGNSAMRLWEEKEKYLLILSRIREC